MTFVVIWEFDPHPAARAEFERAYSPGGVWALLFGRSPDYVGTELLRDLGADGRYLTIDRWTSREAYERFRAEYAAEYRATDQRCEGLTRREALVGAFTGAS
jgi:quinol monooxygenase YgiN